MIETDTSIKDMKLTMKFIDSTEKTYDNVTDIDILQPWTNGGYLKVYQGTDKVVYRTRTQEEYDWLMSKFDEVGCKWFSGERPSDNDGNWGFHISDCCIWVEEKEIYLTYYKNTMYTKYYELIEVSEAMEYDRIINNNKADLAELKHECRILIIKIIANVVLIIILTLSMFAFVIRLGTTILALANQISSIEQKSEQVGQISTETEKRLNFNIG